MKQVSIYSLFTVMLLFHHKLSEKNSCTGEGQYRRKFFADKFRRYWAPLSYWGLSHYLHFCKYSGPDQETQCVFKQEGQDIYKSVIRGYNGNFCQKITEILANSAILGRRYCPLLFTLRVIPLLFFVHFESTLIEYYSHQISRINCKLILIFPAKKLFENLVELVSMETIGFSRQIMKNIYYELVHVTCIPSIQLNI